MARQENQGYQQLTVSTAASALTVPQMANLAVICSTGQNARLRDDGTGAGGVDLIDWSTDGYAFASPPSIGAYEFAA